MIKLKGGKVKIESAGSVSDKKVKLKKLKDPKKVDEKKSLVVSMKDGAMKGLQFEATLPDGKKEKGSIDGAGKISLQVSPSGSTKLELTSLTADLKRTR